VGEHVVHLAGQPSPLGRGGRPRLSRPRGRELIALIAQGSHHPHEQEPRNGAEQRRGDPAAVALRRRYGEQQDDREGEYQDTRATAEPERSHDPDEVRPGLPDALRLDRGEHSGRDSDRDEKRDPARGRRIVAVRLGSDRRRHERDCRHQDDQPAPVETRIGPRIERVDDEYGQVAETQRTQGDGLERRSGSRLTRRIEP
jgi:hypothetical protein